MRTRLLVLLALLVALAALGAGCRAKAAPAPPPAQAVLALTVAAEAEPVLVRRGVTASAARYRLGFGAPGVLATIGVKTGDTVHTGQLLARLKDGSAVAALAAASANRSRAKSDARRTAELVSSGSVAAAQKDEASALLHVADANVSQAAALVADRTLRAPSRGTVVERLAEPGETVAPGVPVLVIEDTRHLVVKVKVTDREVRRLEEKQRASIVVPETNEVIPATVTSVAPVASDDGLYAVEVTRIEEAAAPEQIQKKDKHGKPITVMAPEGSVSREPIKLRPGATVTVRFEARESVPTVRLPIDAVVYRADRAWVLVIEAQKTGTIVKLREIPGARTDGKDVLVTTGLKSGERVVKEGGQFLEDGQPVRLLP